MHFRKVTKRGITNPRNKHQEIFLAKRQNLCCSTTSDCFAKLEPYDNPKSGLDMRSFKTFFVETPVFSTKPCSPLGSSRSIGWSEEHFRAGPVVPLSLGGGKWRQMEHLWRCLLATLLWVWDGFNGTARLHKS